MLDIGLVQTRAFIVGWNMTAPVFAPDNTLILICMAVRHPASNCIKHLGITRHGAPLGVILMTSLRNLTTVEGPQPRSVYFAHTYIGGAEYAREMALPVQRGQL